MFNQCKDAVGEKLEPIASIVSPRVMLGVTISMLQ